MRHRVEMFLCGLSVAVCVLAVALWATATPSRNVVLFHGRAGTLILSVYGLQSTQRFIISYQAFAGIIVPITVLYLMWVFFRHIERPKHKFGICPFCGYDIRATPYRCPECGAKFSKT